MTSAFRVRAAVVLVAVLAVASLTRADEPASTSAQDKSGYQLLNPPPREHMRPLSADRPDTTESPYTVDAGHFQLEMSFFDYGHDDASDANSISVAPMNLKIGLLNNMDLQLGMDPYTKINTPGGDAEGFGDLILRAKFNLWGNDGGDTAFAVMPFIKIPTADSSLGGNDYIEGGIILPLSIELPHEFSLGVMAEFDFVRDSTNGGYGVEFVHTAVLGRPLIGDLAGFVEYIGVAPIDTGGTYQAAFATGLTYALNENVQLDCGTVIGISDSVDDYHVFVGITWRH